jgi:hypothetical protein
MSKRLTITIVLVIAIVTTGTGVGPRVNDLIVHEWGTFTTVAGPDGRAVDWYALAGASDLPCFVEGLRETPGGRQDFPFAITKDGDTVPIRSLPSKLGVRILMVSTPSFDYKATRNNVESKVRMETPVLYFYSPRSMEATVKVEFPRGVMTEWYPRASVAQDDVSTQTMRDARKKSTIWWTNVEINPATRRPMLGASERSHYFAARETDASPLSVRYEEEKFLFYRGLADFDVPLSARVDSTGSVTVGNLGSRPLPLVVLFENRGGRIGFEVRQDLQAATTISRPTLSASFDSLRVHLERALVRAGLYEKEAKAMIATWKDSWFEEGTRVFYLFPSQTVDEILPLTIKPRPDQTVRVFVGRMEVITAEAIEAVDKAVAAGDMAAVQPYARFFGPIADRIVDGRRGTYDAMAIRLLGRHVRESVACDRHVPH